MKNYSLANAALGLQRASNKIVDQLSRRDLVRFMRTPGEAPAIILKAIMRQHEVCYMSTPGHL
eukprot:12260105-Karenia_brevis.AAC.1